MANYIYSTIRIVGDKDYLDRFRQAIDACTECHANFVDFDEYAWAPNVMNYMHINTKKIEKLIKYGPQTFWYDARFDEDGRNLIIEEECRWERSELLDIVKSESGCLIKAYELLYSGLLPPEYGNIKERKEHDC